MEKNKPLSVSEINETLKAVAETHLAHKIYVKGEIANINWRNGHLYFSLKDKLSIISVMYWRCNLDYLENGDIVIVHGKINFYSGRGTYNMIASGIDKCNAEKVDTEYEKLKKKFDQQGYFSKKKNFPPKIRNVALLVSTEGAALQDVLIVLKKNNYIGNIYIKNSINQGNKCSKSIKEGIEYFNNLGKQIDILVICRGGGSEEDLMGYSTEEVVKAIYESNIFTISAIGHEIHFMLSDFAADYRAPTPSVAGEIIIKKQKEEFENLTRSFEKLKNLQYNILSKISNCELILNRYLHACKSCSPVNFINSENERIETIKKKIRDKIFHNIHDSIHELDKLKIKNNVHNIQKVTQKGYAIVTDENDDIIESSTEFQKKIKEKEKLKIMFSDGEVCLDNK
jgi:exodeoxyribonuclease VII large subunit